MACRTEPVGSVFFLRGICGNVFFFAVWRRQATYATRKNFQKKVVMSNNNRFLSDCHARSMNGAEAFETAWDSVQLSDLIRKRYEIRVNPTLADSVSQGYADGDFGSGVLFDTARGKKAGSFSFSESFGDLDDLMMEIAYRGDMHDQVDSMMREFRAGDEDSGQRRFNMMADDLITQIQSQPYTPDQQIPIIHGSLNQGYRGQGLYRKLILPTLIDYLGDSGIPMGSGRYNRSQAATRAHTALQNKNDPRIRHILEKPYDEDWGNPAMIFEMATQGTLNSDDDFCTINCLKPFRTNYIES